ncbi:hypothetical protein ERO13_A09G099601v2 [Gossypium hirsutum]|uniref:Uncharacterized protein n=1 Tax=Gossypium darwinii TaxID=34276 RepID=A0A5D2FAC4_GOSDA|nr:hypothetical protein ERO13_A09G099601v2 [Gossypium hirsutum]KAG4183278.1 hypothetical protein ERO13_A09G099601v2 [Gossypium hirsutum]KAG4183279.1 hypothetical protein ERO13_A09G099601v2 [Gossypium hirsutum]TYH02253.1 hypothetical protein ES288_A09G124900v1 [Gossypium darwinii]
MNMVQSNTREERMIQRTISPFKQKGADPTCLSVQCENLHYHKRRRFLQRVSFASSRTTIIFGDQQYANSTRSYH